MQESFAIQWGLECKRERFWLCLGNFSLPFSIDFTVLYCTCKETSYEAFITNTLLTQAFQKKPQQPPKHTEDRQVTCQVKAHVFLCKEKDVSQQKFVYTKQYHT